MKSQNKKQHNEKVVDLVNKIITVKKLVQTNQNIVPNY